jgi:hypothetical protein
MALESGNYINDLVITNPTSSDPKSQGDDHLRLVKTILKETLNGFTGAILVTAADTGTATGHVLAPSTALVGYTPMLCLLYRANITNTGALTVNVSGLGVKSIKTMAGADPTAGDIVAGYPMLLMYDGTNFVTLGGSEFLSKTGTQKLTGNFTVDGNETVTGTLGVTGNTTLTGTLGVTGLTTLNAAVGLTRTAGDNTVNLATTAFAMNMLSPTFSGVPISTTATAGTNTTQVATTAFVTTSTADEAAIRLAADNLLAPLASPALTGVPTSTTASTGTSTTQIATCAFVAAEAFNSALPAQAGNAGKFVTTDGTNASWGSISPPVGAVIYTSLTQGGF